MTIYAKIITLAATLVALASGAPLQAQTPEIDALRARAEQGDADAQRDLGVMCATTPPDAASRRTTPKRCAGGTVTTTDAVPQDDAEAVRWYRLAADQGQALAQYNLGDAVTPKRCAGIGWRVLAPLTVGDVRLRRYRAVSYIPNGACDLCCVPNVA